MCVLARLAPALPGACVIGPGSPEAVQTRILRAPGRFANLLQRAITGPDQIAERAGRIWAISDYHGTNPHPVPDSVHALPLPARIGATTNLAANVADSAETLAELFNDKDTDVRAAASKALRNITDLDHKTADQLIQAFTKRAAFDDNFKDLIDTLERTDTPLPPLALDVCEKVVEKGGHALDGITTATAMVGTGLITVTLRIYRHPLCQH